MKRLLFTLTIAAAIAAPAVSSASHGGSGGENRDFAVGSGSNQFVIAIGEARLSVGAQSDPLGARPMGHVRAKGDPDGDGPAEPFSLEGEVTCLRVEDNRAAIKYRFKHADGSAELIEGGGVQVFLEDNGPPSGGEAVDGSAFDPPQPPEAFDATANSCDDPSARFYDPIESGNFVVHDAGS